MFKTLRQYENLHILLWLIKDTCWISDFKIGGMVMIIPTFIAAIYIAYITRHRIPEFLHNIAVCCWITANCIWMIGEFYFEDTTRPYAIVFFASGLIVLAFYYLYYLPRHKEEAEALVD